MTRENPTVAAKKQCFLCFHVYDVVFFLHSIQTLLRKPFLDPRIGRLSLGYEGLGLCFMRQSLPCWSRQNALKVAEELLIHSPASSTCPGFSFLFLAA